MNNFSNTPKGKIQAKKMIDCRLELGCNSARDFFDKFSKGRFSYTQYQKYESGERLLNKKSAILYANIFNKNWEWLLSDDDASEIKKQDDMITLDVLDVNACCGTGIENFTENVIGQQMITLPALRELTSAAPENIKIIKAIGESMIPTIYPNDVMWVDISVKIPTSDGLYVLCIGSDLMIKRIQINPFDLSAVIKSDNPLYGDFKKENYQEINVVGKVIYHMKRMS